MLHSSPRALDIPLASMVGSGFLWGATSADRAVSAVEGALKRSGALIATIDLRGVRAFDPLFAERVFVAMVVSAKSSGRVLCFEVDNEELLRELNDTLRSYSLLAPIKYRGCLRLGGSTSFHERVIFDRLLTASPVAAKVVCEEFGEAPGECEYHFTQLMGAGLARRIRPDIYGWALAQHGFTAWLRSVLKGLKLRVALQPLHRTSIGRRFAALLRPPSVEPARVYSEVEGAGPKTRPEEERGSACGRPPTKRRG